MSRSLHINEQGYDCPDNTYFTTGDVQPELVLTEEGEQLLKLMNGQGQRRSWGTPTVTSTVILESEDIVSIHTGYNTKHGGGQFWRHYQFNTQQDRWVRVRWADLADADRQRILIAYEDRAPNWAKAPGKTRDQYRLPTLTVKTSYKLVLVTKDGRYLSVYAYIKGTNSDPKEIEYVLGKRLIEKAVSEHGGGYYSYPTPDRVFELFHEGKLFPKTCYEYPMTLALLECEISGTLIEYTNGKVASTYLRPIREIQRFDYMPPLQQEAV